VSFSPIEGKFLSTRTGPFAVLGRFLSDSLPHRKRTQLADLVGG